MSRSANARQNLKVMADKTKLQLAWLVPLYWVLHDQKAKIKDITDSFIDEPERFQGPGERMREIRDRAVQIICEAEQRGEKREDDPGHYLNKAAIVYAMTLIDRFVQQVYLAMYRKKSVGHLFFGTLLCKIAKKLPGFYDTPEVKRIRLLAEIRNNIIHDFGKVNQDLLDKADLAEVWPEMGGEQGFRDANEIQDLQNPPNVDLNILRVGLPALDYCTDFVEFAFNEVNKMGLA